MIADFVPPNSLKDFDLQVRHTQVLSQARGGSLMKSSECGNHNAELTKCHNRGHMRRKEVFGSRFGTLDVVRNVHDATEGYESVQGG